MPSLPRGHLLIYLPAVPEFCNSLLRAQHDYQRTAATEGATGSRVVHRLHTGRQADERDHVAAEAGQARQLQIDPRAAVGGICGGELLRPALDLNRVGLLANRGCEVMRSRLD